MGQLPDGWTIDRINSSGVADAKLVDPETYVVEDRLSELVELTPTVIIDCGELYLVHDKTDKNWHMGQMDGEGNIWCWGSYGQDLGVAIRGL